MRAYKPPTLPEALGAWQHSARLDRKLRNIDCSQAIRMRLLCPTCRLLCGILHVLPAPCVGLPCQEDSMYGVCYTLTLCYFSWSATACTHASYAPAFFVSPAVAPPIVSLAQ